jgi:uncharacterized protein
MNIFTNLFEYWYLGLMAVFIATFANLIGAGGSKFFSPLYMYYVRLNPILSIVCGLFTQMFGFGSGSLSYHLQKEIDYKIALAYLKYVIPTTMVGAIAAHFVPANFVEIVFALILILNSVAIMNYERLLKQIELNVSLGMVAEQTVMLLGSFFLGFISVGLGELITPTFLFKYKLKPQRAIGTAVFIVFVSTLTAVLTHIGVMEYLGQSIFQLKVIHVLVCTVPGAIIGAQIGSRISAYVPRAIFKKVLTIVFFLLGVSILILKARA